MASHCSEKENRAVSLSFSAITNALRDFSFPPCEIVVGIARGGVVPACLVAYRLHCDVKIIQIAYRSEDNAPEFSEPQVVHAHIKIGRVKNILIVDDVSQSGKTLRAACRLFPKQNVHTMVFKGRAELVLFPEIVSCVQWPWKVNEKRK